MVIIVFDNPVEEQDPRKHFPDSSRSPPAIHVTARGGCFIVTFRRGLLGSLGVYVRGILLFNILVLMTLGVGRCGSGLRPPVAAGPTWYETAEGNLSVSQGVLIILGSAFKQALDNQEYYSVDASTRQEAIELYATANDPDTLGVFGEISPTGNSVPFEGTVFMVVRDLQLADEGKTVIAQDYYVGNWPQRNVSVNGNCSRIRYWSDKGKGRQPCVREK